MVLSPGYLVLFGSDIQLCSGNTSVEVRGTIFDIKHWTQDSCMQDNDLSNISLQLFFTFNLQSCYPNDPELNRLIYPKVGLCKNVDIIQDNLLYHFSKFLGDFVHRRVWKSLIKNWFPIACIPQIPLLTLLCLLFTMFLSPHCIHLFYNPQTLAFNTLFILFSHLLDCR